MYKYSAIMIDSTVRNGFEEFSPLVVVKNL